MSRYKIPISQFGKLEISTTPANSTRGYDAMPVTTRSAAKQRRHATSSQASSSAGPSRYQSGSSSTSRQGTQHSNQQRRRQSEQAQRAEDNPDEDDEDEDDRDDDDDDGDDSGDDPPPIMQPQNLLRVAEVLSVMTDMHLLPDEFLPYLNTPTLPAQAPVQIRLVHHVGRTLLREISTVQSMNNFLVLGGVTRTQVLGLAVQNLRRRFDNICDQLYRNERNAQDGNDVQATVTLLDDFQENRLFNFSDTYRRRGLLANTLQDGLSRIVVGLLAFVIRGDQDLYVHTAAQRPANMADTYGGNLYRRWRDLGNSQHLFSTLSLFRNRIQQTGARQTDAKFMAVDNALRNKNDVIWQRFNNAL